MDDDWEFGPDLPEQAEQPETDVEPADDTTPLEQSTAKEDLVPTYTPNPDLSPLGQAVSLALSILANTKKATWLDLDGSIPGDIVVTDAQIALLREHLEPISFLQGVDRVVGRQSRTVAYCPDCGEWLITSRNVGKCVLTFGCKGDLKKVPAATKTKAAG